MVQLGQKGSRTERGLCKVEARRYRYALSSYSSLSDNTAILVYGLRELRNARDCSTETERDDLLVDLKRPYGRNKGENICSGWHNIFELS